MKMISPKGSGKPIHRSASEGILLFYAALQFIQKPKEFRSFFFCKRAEQLIDFFFSLVLQLAGACSSLFRQGDQSRPLV